jgi:hypothetical protein
MDGCFVITIKRGWVGELLEHVFLAYGHLNDSFSGYWEWDRETVKVDVI